MESPVVLGVESSCDETGAGLVRHGRLLGHAVASSEERCRTAGIALRVPPIVPCTDNRAMIAAVGDLLLRAGAEPAPLDVSVTPPAPLVCASLHPAAPLAGAA